MRRRESVLLSATMVASIVVGVGLLGCGEEAATDSNGTATSGRPALTSTPTAATARTTTILSAPTSPTETVTTNPGAESPLEVLAVECNPPGDDDASLDEEYITFRVLTTGPLLGYAVEDDSGNHYDFPAGTFSAGQVFKLHTGAGTDGEGDLYWGSPSAVWDNGSDTVIVLDPQGRVVISRLYFSPAGG